MSLRLIILAFLLTFLDIFEPGYSWKGILNGYVLRMKTEGVEISRRNFISKTAVTSAGLASLTTQKTFADIRTQSSGRYENLNLKMKNIGLSNGIQMPVLGLGTAVNTPEQTVRAVKHAILSGYRHIDCGYNYGNQIDVGTGISEALKNSNIQREELFIASKLHITHLRKDDVNENFQDTMNQFRNLDYLDLFLIHWPYALKKQEPYAIRPRDANGNPDVDPRELDLLETWAEMEKLVDAGKVKSIGISNFSEEQTSNILKNCRIRPVVNQIECHPYLNQSKMKEYLDTEGIQLVAYCPLGNSLPENTQLERPLSNEVIISIADKRGKSPAQVILRWHLQKGHVVIPKSATPSRIDENRDIFDFELSNEEMNQINQLGSKNIRYINPRLRPNGDFVFLGETSIFP